MNEPTIGRDQIETAPEGLYELLGEPQRFEENSWDSVNNCATSGMVRLVVKIGGGSYLPHGEAIQEARFRGDGQRVVVLWRPVPQQEPAQE